MRWPTLELATVLLASCLTAAPGHAHPPPSEPTELSGDRTLSLDDLATLDALLEADSEENRPLLEPGTVIDIAGLGLVWALALVSFVRKSDRLKIVTLVLSVAYLDLFQDQSGLDRRHLRDNPVEPAGLCVRGLLLFADWVHGGLHSSVGTALLRPGVRVRCADTTARHDRACAISGGAAAVVRSTNRVSQVSHSRGRRHAHVSLHRTVLDVHDERKHDRVDAVGDSSGRDAVRPQFLLSLLVRGRAGLGLLSNLTIFRSKR